MQTSLSSPPTSSHTHSSVGGGTRALYESTRGILELAKSTLPLSARSSSRGFTLVELMVSAAIIIVIASLVIARFVNFDGTVVLRSAAYDVATSLREAQIYSVSVTNALGGGATTFRYPYGLSFAPTSATSYTFYRYNSTDSSVIPEYDTSAAPTEERIRVMMLSGSTEIADLCVVVNGNPDCDVDRLDISFRRPEFSALIHAEGVASPNISAAQIKLRSSRNPGNVWVVEIKLLGQITVYKE